MTTPQPVPTRAGIHPPHTPGHRGPAWPAWLLSAALASAWLPQAQAQAPAQGLERATASAPAQANPAITLAAAWDKALAANPGLQAARHGAAAAEGLVVQSQARPNPELAVSIEDTRRETRTHTVQINQLIELGGKREARMQLADTEKSAAEAGVVAALAALRYQLQIHFNELLLAQQRVDFATQTHALATQALDAANKRVQAGKVPPLEASRAQVAQANAAMELEQARSLTGVAQHNLAALWGGRGTELGLASGDFLTTTAAPTAEQLDQRLDEAPAMVLAQRALAQSQATSALERAKRVQDPTVTLGVKRAQDVGRNQVFVGVSIPLPLFDRNAGNQLQALRKVDQAEQQLQDQRLQLQAQVFAARQQWLSSNQQVALLQSQVIPTAQSAYDLAVRGFSLGKFSFLDVLDAQRSLFDSQRQLLDQLMASHRARAEIERIFGTPALAAATGT
ncbi:TolC family protein [Comamonas sp. MYb396]|uniref:TolC family protein n=1 Tax=Comamonas sp. MYb396 TaxID=2745302 RepID=UPI0030B37AF2